MWYSQIPGSFLVLSLMWILIILIQSCQFHGYLIAFRIDDFYMTLALLDINKGIRDAGSTADLRMLWSAIVCLGLL